MERSSCQKIPSVEVFAFAFDLAAITSEACWFWFLLVWTCKTLSVILGVIVHITNGPIRNSDPRLRIVFFHGLNSNFHTKFELLESRRDFQNRSNSRVSLNPSCRFRSWIVSRKGVFATSYWSQKKFTSIPCHEILVQLLPHSYNPASLQNLLNLSSGESCRTCWKYFCKATLEFWGSSWAGTSALTSPRTIDWPSNTTGSPVLSGWPSYSSHIAATAP